MKPLIRAISPALTLAAQVPYERIRDAAAEPGSWLTYSGNYQAHRFSPLREITPANAPALKVKWIYQIKTAGGLDLINQFSFEGGDMGGWGASLPGGARGLVRS